MLAAVSTSVYFVVSKPMLTHYRPLEFTTYIIWAGTIPMLIFAPGLAEQLTTAPLSATLAVIYLGSSPRRSPTWPGRTRWPACRPPC